MASVKIIRFKPELCKGHMECEKACSNILNKNDKGGEWSAIRIHETGTGYEMSNCNHCGLCIDMCPVQAIKRLANGTVVINKKLCVGCMACVGFCPRGVMRKVSEIPVPFKCISCNACVKACPEGALELVEVELDGIEETVYSYQGVC